MEGWIKLHRKLLKNPFSRDIKFLGLWTYLLLKANFEDNKALIDHSVVDVKRGQFITSISKLATEFKVNRTTLKRMLDVLKCEQMVNIETNTKYTVITINNYSDYQQVEQQVNIKRTSSEHQVNTSKKEKKEKNNNTVEYLKQLPVADLQAFKSKYTLLQENEIQGEATKAYNWILSKGYQKKYKDFRHFFHNWLDRINDGKAALKQPELSKYKLFVPQEVQA